MFTPDEASISTLSSSCALLELCCFHQNVETGFTTAALLLLLASALRKGPETEHPASAQHTTFTEDLHGDSKRNSAPPERYQVPLLLTRNNHIWLAHAELWDDQQHHKQFKAWRTTPLTCVKHCASGTLDPAAAHAPSLQLYTLPSDLRRSALCHPGKRTPALASCCNCACQVSHFRKCERSCPCCAARCAPWPQIAVGPLKNSIL